METQIIGVEPIGDRNVYYDGKELSVSAPIDARLCCFDLRRLEPNLPEQIVYDVRTFLGDERSLVGPIRKFIPDRKENMILAEVEARWSAQRRAWKVARMPGNPLPIPPDVSETFSRELLVARTSAYRDVFERIGDDRIREYESIYPLRLTLFEIEKNGIHVDVDLATRLLRSSELSPSEGACLRSILSLEKSNRVFSLFDPYGGKTGRVRAESGFASMSIPHGPCRDTITSRFEGGSIYAFDFNAIDYRCIVSAIGGDFARIYRGQKDFHRQTALFLFSDPDKLVRDTIKFISYVYIYGGSEETLSQKTGLSVQTVKNVLQKLDLKLSPVRQFREDLWKRLNEIGWIDLPHGGRVVKTQANHVGQLLGLYAQSYSSKIFSKATILAQQLLREKKSKIITPVHDELVVDVHPDEEQDGLPGEICKIMEWCDDHVVKIKKGRTYREATE